MKQQLAYYAVESKIHMNFLDNIKFEIQGFRLILWFN